jgi:hypothetical protein
LVASTDVVERSSNTGATKRIILSFNFQCSMLFVISSKMVIISLTMQHYDGCVVIMI